MNPSLNKTKFQTKYQMFFFLFSLFVRKQINFYSVQCSFTMEIQFWSKVIHDYIDCKRVYFRKV